MKEKPTRRAVLEHAARGAGLIGIAGAAAYLGKKASAEDAWRIDTSRCINSRLGETTADVCEQCRTDCVVPLSAVRAVNDFANCGRCAMCPAYFDVTSEIDESGMPSRKTCPRDAIQRTAIGEVDPDDPFNNYYEYVIDEELCDGCGRCVMACKEPAGLGSIRLEVRYSLCLDCNRCSIDSACPHDAYYRGPARALVKPATTAE